MPTISYPITLATVDYTRDLPKIQGISPSVLTGEGGRSAKYTYTSIESFPLLFTSPDVTPLAPIISSLIDIQGLASVTSAAAYSNLLYYAGSRVPIKNTYYPESLASGMAFAGTRPVGDTTMSIILPTSIFTADGNDSPESVTVRIFCYLDDNDWPNLVVQSDVAGIYYTYKLPNKLPYFIFNFAVTAPGGSVVPTRRVKYTSNSNLIVVPGGGSGASLQLTAVLYTKPYRDYDTAQQVTDSIEITYTLADPYARLSSSAVGYQFYVSDPATCNGIDTVEIKANLSWSQSLSNTYRKTYQLSTILPGGIPHEYYWSNTNVNYVKNKVTQFLENAGKWTTTITSDALKRAQSMSLLLAGSPTMVYPTKTGELFYMLKPDLLDDYDRLNYYGLCHMHPCTNFNPEGLFYTPLFKSSGGYDSVLQDVTTVNLTANYYGVPGKPSIFSNSPVVDSQKAVWDTTWNYSAKSNALLPGVGATGAYGWTKPGSGNYPPIEGDGITTPSVKEGHLSSSDFEQAGPAAIVINF